MQKRLGKPGTLRPRWARAPPRHVSCRSAPPTPRDRHRRQELGGREAGAPDQHVGLVQRAVVGAHAAGLQPGDPPGDHLDVLAGQRGVPVVGEEQPLAADRVVRHQPAAQRPVRHLPAQGEPPGGPHRGDQRPADGGAAGERGVEPLGDPEDRPPLGGQAGRHPTEEPRGAARSTPGPASARRTARCAGRPSARPTRSTMPGTSWMALAPVPTTATRSPGQVDVVAPLRGVEGRAVEVGPGWTAPPGWRAGRPPRRRGPPRAGPPVVRTCQTPVASSKRAPSTSVPVRTRSSRPSASAVAREVGEDLRLAGVAPAPVRVGRPRPGVERRRHVARGVGVGVVAPDAADLVGALQDDHVAQAAAQQLAGHAQAAEARPR